MGCVVNGAGEMADADVGYVGWGAGKINLVVGKGCVAPNIPEAEADGPVSNMADAGTAAIPGKRRDCPRSERGHQPMAGLDW